MSKSQKERFTREDVWIKGKTHSEETKKKLSEKLKGNFVSS